MHRNIRTSYGTSSVQLYDRMKIQPPLFASIGDAYKHFVRHPEDRQLVDNPDGWRPFGDSMDDCFDRMESFNDTLARHQNEGAGSEAPVSVSSEPASEVPKREVSGDSPESDPS